MFMPTGPRSRSSVPMCPVSAQGGDFAGTSSQHSSTAAFSRMISKYAWFGSGPHPGQSAGAEVLSHFG